MRNAPYGTIDPFIRKVIDNINAALNEKRVWILKRIVDLDASNRGLISVNDVLKCCRVSCKRHVTRKYAVISVLIKQISMRPTLIILFSRFARCFL